MEFIRNFTHLDELKTKRLAQLERRQRLLRQIQQNKNQCPNDVVDFLMYMSMFNLAQSRRTYTSSIIQSIGIIPEILEENKQLNDRIETVVLRKNMCEALRDFTLV